MELNFEGWDYGDSNNFPEAGGIYCVFSEPEGQLIYIGQAANIRNRIQQHERWPDFRRHETGNGIAITYALLDGHIRDPIEARLIQRNAPPENDRTSGTRHSGALNLRGFLWGLSA
jgi:hypothetical protein